jgi:hypothetical protein
MLPGHDVTLGDGNAWLVPVARLPVGEAGAPAVPKRVVLDDEGAARAEPRPEWVWLWQLACEFWDEWIAAAEAVEVYGDCAAAKEAGLAPDPAAPVPPPPPERFRWVAWNERGRIVENTVGCFDTTARLLAVNYRVSPFEVGELGLVASECAPAAALAAVDWPSMEDLEKKAATGA